MMETRGGYRRPARHSATLILLPHATAPTHRIAKTPLVHTLVRDPAACTASHQARCHCVKRHSSFTPQPTFPVPTLAAELFPL